LNTELDVEGVLLTMADYRTNLSRAVINEVKDFFLTEQGVALGGQEKVYQTIIPRSIKITEAPGFGKPIALYAATSIGAKKYEDVVREMLGISLTAEPFINKEVTTNMEESHGEKTG